MHTGRQYLHSCSDRIETGTYYLLHFWAEIPELIIYDNIEPSANMKALFKAFVAKSVPKSIIRDTWVRQTSIGAMYLQSCSRKAIHYKVFAKKTHYVAPFFVIKSMPELNSWTVMHYLCLKVCLSRSECAQSRAGCSAKRCSEWQQYADLQHVLVIALEISKAIKLLHVLKMISQSLLIAKMFMFLHPCAERP